MHRWLSARNQAWCAVISSLLMAGCLGSGSCTETEAFAFNSIRHYGDEELVPAPQPNGGCGASLVTGDDPDAVIDHYHSELERVGFVVSSLEPSSSAGEPEAAAGRTLGLRGMTETAVAWITAEGVVDGQDSMFLILMDEID